MTKNRLPDSSGVFVTLKSSIDAGNSVLAIEAPGAVVDDDCAEGKRVLSSVEAKGRLL